MLSDIQVLNNNRYYALKALQRKTNRLLTDIYADTQDEDIEEFRGYFDWAYRHLFDIIPEPVEE